MAFDDASDSHHVEAYQVNDIIFNNAGYTIEQVTQNTPLMRGQNLTPAMDHGDRWREKRLGGRTETWNMWITDADPTTNTPPSTNKAQRAQFHDNWDVVMNILNTTHTASGYDAPLKVVRRMQSNPSSPADKYRINYGEMNGQISVRDYRAFVMAKFSVNVFYPDPRWYECNSAGAKTTSTLTATGNPDGTALMTDMTITLGDGSVNDPYIENTTTGSKLTFSGNPTGAVVINTSNYTLTDNGTNAIGSLDRTGSTTTDWFRLQPNISNTLASNTTFSIAYTKAFI
tara:strand:+ start:9460 stop:10317 length:858 start_codon:yes stop_codon:yes gene_type:complete